MFVCAYDIKCTIIILALFEESNEFLILIKLHCIYIVLSVNKSIMRRRKKLGVHHFFWFLILVMIQAKQINCSVFSLLSFTNKHKRTITTAFISPILKMKWTFIDFYQKGIWLGSKSKQSLTICIGKKVKLLSFDTHTYLNSTWPTWPC